MEFLTRRDLLALGAAVIEPFAAAQNGNLRAKIDIYSRHLLWLREAGEVAEAAKKMGFDGVDVTVRPGLGGHVAPERVAQDLPPFVRGLRENGLQVISITAPITDADSSHAEEILKTASELEIRNYWWGTFRYDMNAPVMRQLDELKPRIAKLASLNAKYKVCAMYHTFAGTSVGASIWDLYSVLKDFDPALVGFHYDTGHMASEGAAGSWTTNLRMLGPYLRGVAVKDYAWNRAENGQWTRRAVPLGEGIVRLPQFASILKQMQFAGPIEIQAEYPNGGADQGRAELTLPRDQVLTAMGKDQETLRRALDQAGI